jgi:hypothetical protein
MRFSNFWKLFHRKPKFYALRSEIDNDEEDGIESKELLEKRTLARKPAHSAAWIFLTITNVVILSINIFLVFSGKNSFSSDQKNAILRPVSWWCKSLCLDQSTAQF